MQKQIKNNIIAVMIYLNSKVFIHHGSAKFNLKNGCITCIYLFVLLI